MTNMNCEQEAKQQYLAVYGPTKTPYIYSYAPGRMNFIGEHVDYLGGCVVPAALTLATHTILTAEPADKWMFSFRSDRMEDGKIINFSLDDKANIPIGKSFLSTMFGCVFEQWKFCKVDENPNVKDHPMHVRALVMGRVPLGSGMSSSTSVCISVSQALSQIFNPMESEFHRSQPLNENDKLKLAAWKKQLILACSNVERHWCGVNGGLMDQYTSIFGELNTVLKIDCGLLEHTNVNFPDPNVAHYEVMLVDSMRPHDLGNAYNLIRKDMEEAEKKMTMYLRERNNKNLMCKDIPEFNNETPLKLKMLPFKTVEGMPAVDWMKKLHKEGILNDGEYNRASYAVEEMERTDRFTDLTKDENLKANPKEMLRKMGEYINQTHEGLANKLKVSTPELDKICELMNSLPGTYGARLMGGGFGGCTICLVDTDTFNAECREKLLSGFKAAFDDLDRPNIFNSGIGRGAHVELNTEMLL